MPPKKDTTFLNMLKYEAKQFCLNTALHGYRFIVLPKRILLERVFWGLTVIISLIVGITLLFAAWVNFQNNPTISVTDSTHYPIWNYPFPAVTICSFNKLSKKKTTALAKKLLKPYDITSEELAQQLKLSFQLLTNNNPTVPSKNYTRLQDILESNDFTVEKALEELAPKCKDILQRCKWKGEEKRCESIFEQIMTTEGYCCSFNYYALKNHTFSGALPNKIPKYPRRVSACGYLTALEVLVDSDPEDYFASQISAIGNKVLLHNSYNFPDGSSQVMLTEKGIINLVGITPTITYSTDVIQSVDLKQRKCLFSNESELHNFVHYNFHNCMVECRMNITRTLCGCVPFYYYNPRGTYPHVKNCTLRDLQCLRDNQHLIISSVPGFDFEDIPSNHKWGSEKSLCNCLADCEYVDYLGESSSGVFTRKYSSNQLNLFGGVTIKDQSVLRVYFNDLVGTKNRRDVVFTWHTLLAYYGGLLGLFIGFSFVSAVELVYFFTIRLVVDIMEKNAILQKKKPKKLLQVKQSQEIRNPRKIVPNRFTIRRRSNSNS